jgi:hypothetical protein
MSLINKVDFRKIVTIRGIEYMVLVVAVLSYVLFLPIFSDSKWEFTAFTVLISIILISATYTIANNVKIGLISLGILIPSLVIMWINLAYPYGNLITIASRILWLALLGIVAFVLLRDIRNSKGPIPKEVLWSAVALYLIFGLAWAILYSVIELNVPGSFLHTIHPTEPISDTDFIYYSFVTLATLGYGEILPMTAQAKSFVILEIVTGVLYLAILIAVFLKRVE